MPPDQPASPIPPASPMPVRIAILAMGGEGGGVLADWIVDAAEQAGFHAQTTSVPGVAQRTGATLYYVEVLPVARAGSATPVLGLMPVPGDVDVVIASELMESARAVQRGLVTPDRTLLITSSSRVYALPEKMAPGDGRRSAAELRDAGRAAAARYVCADFAGVAERAGSVISAVLFGALAAAEALPLARRDFEAAIERGGVGVAASLRAFAAGHAAFGAAASPAEAQTGDPAPGEPRDRDARLARLDARIAREFPAPAHRVLQAGVARVADYQDLDYADGLLDRLGPVVQAAAGLPAATGTRLVDETARYLALWMSYEDVARVAELKIRPARFERLRSEHRLQPGQGFAVREFMHPRLDEIVDALPAGLGRWLQRTGWARRLVARHTRQGRVIVSNGLGGFLLLYLVAATKRFRRSTLRFAREWAAIDAWLALLAAHVRQQPALACEIAQCPRLVKGYGDTHARGLARYQALMALVPRLAAQPDGAATLGRLRALALADDRDGRFDREIDALRGDPPPGQPAE